MLLLVFGLGTYIKDRDDAANRSVIANSYQIARATYENDRDNYSSCINDVESRTNFRRVGFSFYELNQTFLDIIRELGGDTFPTRAQEALDEKKADLDETFPELSISKCGEAPQPPPVPKELLSNES